MEDFISLLLHSRTQTHSFHLGVEKYSAHKALQKYYEGIVDMIDTITESYQGKYGLVKFKSVTGLDTDNSVENIISYFEKLAKYVSSKRSIEALKDSFIQNEIDTIEVLIYKTIYKLKNLN
jgi:DNA-binding ferritin-like protein